MAVEIEEQFWIQLFLNMLDLEMELKRSLQF